MTDPATSDAPFVVAQPGYLPGTAGPELCIDCRE